MASQPVITETSPAPSQRSVSQTGLLTLMRTFCELVDLDDLVKVVMAKTRELLQAESSAVLLLDSERNELYFPYVADEGEDVERRLLDVRFPADQGIAGWVLQHQNVEIVNDASHDPRWYQKVDAASGAMTRSLLCAPLLAAGATVGVIELRNKVGGDFTAEDAELLGLLADGIAVAIGNAQLLGRVNDTAARLRDEVLALQRDAARQSRFSDIIGNSAAMQRVFALMESAIAAPVTVLLQGETGTGKEIIARAIHYNGDRRERPFVAVNCGALQETLLESELFGHRRGAFTGALEDRKGIFEVAHGGTVFLDEVGDMPPAMQMKLLRVLQEGEIVPIGTSTPRSVDVRVISATHRDLEAGVRSGSFREDLYYRLNAFPIHVPPLRERGEDIALLAVQIAERTARKFGRTPVTLTPAVIDRLLAYPWPGNVRELQNEIERAVALLGTADTVRPTHLSEKLSAATRAHTQAALSGPVRALSVAREEFERRYIADVLAKFDGNAVRAAKALGLSRTMLQNKIRRYGLRKRAASR